MTEIERRLVKQLWFVLYGTFDRLLHLDGGRNYGSNFVYRTLHKLYWQNEPLDPATRDFIVALAWEHRATLPPDLALAVALKGGCRLSEHMITAGDGDPITDPESPRSPDA